MPLVHRRTVPLLPPPNIDNLPSDTQVFYLKVTNEIFLDYACVVSPLPRSGTSSRRSLTYLGLNFALRYPTPCRAYTTRMAYLSSNIFQCEFSGKSNLTYFAAVESEKAESRVVRERFPDELKGRVLVHVQFRESSAPCSKYSGDRRT